MWLAIIWLSMGMRSQAAHSAAVVAGASSMQHDLAEVPQSWCSRGLQSHVRMRCSTLQVPRANVHTHMVPATGGASGAGPAYQAKHSHL